MIPNLSRRLQFLTVLLSISFFACSRKSELIIESAKDDLMSATDSNYVSTVTAISKAKDFNFKIVKDKNAKVLSLTEPKQIKSYKTVSSIGGKNAFYIISYKDRGFAIISADKRTPSVLAYSDANGFPTDSVPLGVNMWLYDTRAEIERIRESNVRYEGQDTMLHSSTATNKVRDKKTTVSGTKPLDPPCEDQYFVTGPLLQTEWDQIGGYNNYMDNMACAPYYNNGKAFTGCVATAMAQIIRYHQYPASYNYSIMPASIPSYDTYSAGALEVSRLMHDAAVSVNSESDCNGTGAAKDISDIVNALKNTFGYQSTVKKADFNYQTVLSEIRSNRPVLLSGYSEKDKTWIFFNSYGGGHVWVADGSQEFYVCTEDGSGRDGYLYFHMNWGWGPYSGCNGWFGFNSSNSGNGNYQYKRQMITGIKKP